MKSRFLWRAYKTRYRDQVAELEAIKRYIRPSDTVCDIGANKGGYIYWLSRWVPLGRVIAFEPQERLAHYLRGVCAALQLKNVLVEAKAVDANSGTQALHVPGTVGDSPGASLSRKISTSEECRRIPVEVVSLDDYFDQSVRLGVLKIDVEGAEMRVLKGACRILKDRSPLLVFECENRHLETGNVLDVFGYLGDLGYSGKFVCGSDLRPLKEFDPAIHQKQSGARFWDKKHYCNNFIFRKQAD